MKKIIISVLLSCVCIFAQENPLQFDYAKFKYDSVNTYLEVYYLVQQKSLVKIKNNDTFHIEGLLKVQISDEKGNIVKNHDLKFQNAEKDSNVFGSERPLFGVIPFSLAPGKYKMEVSLKDLKSGKMLSQINDKVSINNWKNSAVTLSDIQLATNLIPDAYNANSQFYKNTYEVYPNPMMLYTKDMPVLYYYLELYNLNLTKSKNCELSVVITDNLKTVVYKSSSKIACNNESRVEVGRIDLSKLGTNSYVISIVLKDSLGNQAYQSTKKFFYYNPDKIKQTITSTVSVDYVKSEFSLLSEEECDIMYAKMKYILRGADQKKYAQIITEEGKRKFMYEFWTSQEMNSDNPITKEQYMERANIADKRYTAGGKDGWKTDRGRIYILYGEPSEYDRYPNSFDMKPYEIWRYNQLEGGVYFIFGDISGMSNYELLTSTKRGELQDDNWESKLQMVK